MKQLTQSLKDGAMQLLEVPYPALNPGHVLVRVHYSLISAGTEGKTVRDARLGYIGKARARREEVKKVIQTAKTLGWLSTYKMVMNKLDAPSALGYSCAGEIIAVADDVKDLRIGDKVACGGSGAVHAEVVSIPLNLCVKLDTRTDLRAAAFTTVGAIAMQGVRQADLRLGENCVVIGLGLVGQLTVQLLHAAGVKTIAVDIDPKQVERAKTAGVIAACRPDDPTLKDQVAFLSEGHGCDAVIIAASTSSLDPVELAGELCRRKGKVIIVGAVPTGFSRKNYYNKELDLRMSCSYGPGRYDAEYEEQGIDYPYAYVRWTENRNMQAFADLIAGRKIDLQPIISHEFAFGDATKAYDMILQKQESFAGILLKYETGTTIQKEVRTALPESSGNEPSIGFIGAGSFAQNMLLPNITGRAHFAAVCTARPNNAQYLAGKYGFALSTTDAQSLLQQAGLNTVFVATRHNTHFEYTLAALKAGKHVFVEKPLCMTEKELEEVSTLQAQTGKMVMVGFNRRFAPLIVQLKKQLNNSLPAAIHYRINAGVVPADHWTQDPTVGGGRIIGEVCHFIDLCRFIAGSPITSISGISMDSAAATEDTVEINMRFANGSIAGISYFANGSKDLSKEFIEVFQAGNSYQLDDFKTLNSFGKARNTAKLSGQDKGHKAEVEAFLAAIKSGAACPIAYTEIHESMLATFRVIESIRSGGQAMQL